MLYKKRGKPYKLRVMELLQYRIVLTSEGRKELSNQESGYTGECSLDTMTGELTCDCLVLNDVPLILNGTEFQIDALIITPDEVGLYEVKNYKGEYFYNDGFFEGVHSDLSFHSPTERVNRHTSLLRSLLKKHHFAIPIKQYVVFIHPEFIRGVSEKTSGFNRGMNHVSDARCCIPLIGFGHIARPLLSIRPLPCWQNSFQTTKSLSRVLVWFPEIA